MRATAKNLPPRRSGHSSPPDRTDSNSVQSRRWTAHVSAKRPLYQTVMRCAALVLLASGATLSPRWAHAQSLLTAGAPVRGAFQVELAPATQVDPAAASLEAQVAELRQQLDQLERLRTNEAKQAEEAAAKKQVEQAAQALKEEAANKNRWNVKLGGHVQMDYVTWADTDASIVDPFEGNYFSFRRLRLVADGTGYENFDFRLQMTLEPGLGADENAFASPDVKDAYLSMNEIPLLGRMRIGNFFVPFSLEQVTNDTNNNFTERSIPSQNVFAADREVGLAFYNCTESKDITWTTGVFFDDLNDTFKTRFDSNQGLRLAGRLTWLPYYDAASQGRYLVHTGVGILHTEDYDDRVRFRTRPHVQRGPVLMDSRNLDAERYTTGNIEAAIVWGPVTLQSEAFLSSVDMLTEERLNVGGAYAHLSYFLTGENRVFEPFGQHGPQFGRNKPSTNFFITRSGMGWGAWEAKTRWSLLDLSSANAGQYNDLTVGFNWYWSDRTRVMFDWIRPLTDNETVFGSTESDLLAMRFDFNW